MNIAVIGYGIEGKTVANYFAKRGHKITVCDVNKETDLKETGFGARLGAGYLERLGDFDKIFRSPGIPYLKKEFEPVRDKMTSLIRYFFEKCPCPIVGVTGTKGKGTVSGLIYEMAKEARAKTNSKVFWGGNVGMPPLDFLDELKSEDLVVLELSSFQLQDLTVSPHVAVVLGITPDHMDHHGTMEEYVAAKRNLVKFQKSEDVAILDIDNEVAAGFKKDTPAQMYKVSLAGSTGDGGTLKVGSLIIKKGKTGTIVGHVGETKLVGLHNIKNLLLAATAATAIGVPVEVITKIVREFPGLPHRLEFIKEAAGVKFYNDSASTNPHTAIAALRSFEEPTILIAGGSDKNTDFTPLGTEIAARKNVKAVVLMGETKTKIEQVIELAIKKAGGREIPLELISADSYQEAFMVSRAIAGSGDVVLLSPACASFDMFGNYKERGDIFRNFVIEFCEM